MAVFGRKQDEERNKFKPHSSKGEIIFIERKY